MPPLHPTSIEFNYFSIQLNSVQLSLVQFSSICEHLFRCYQHFPNILNSEYRADIAVFCDDLAS